MPSPRVSPARVLCEMVTSDATSRRELCERIGVSKASIGRVVERLVAAGCIEEGERLSKTRRGRKTTSLGVKADLAYFLGADMEGLAIRACMLDARKRKLASAKRPVGARWSTKRIVKEWTSLIQEVIESAGVPRRKIAGLGVGLPARVTKDKFRSLAFLPPGRWMDFDFGEVLSQFGLPVTAADNVVCVSEYERRMGRAGEADSFISVLIRYGLGIVICTDGSFIVGEDMSPGQLGHMRVDLDGPLCVCGRRGCLDVFASGRTWPAAHKRTGAAWTRELARRSRYIGIGLSNVLKLIHPPMVILNGIYNHYEAAVRPVVMETVREELAALGLPVPELVFGELVPFKTSMGAALRAADAFLEPFLLANVLAPGGADGKKTRGERRKRNAIGR